MVEHPISKSAQTISKTQRSAYAWIRCRIAAFGEVCPQPDDGPGDVLLLLLAREEAAQEGLRGVEVVEVVVAVAHLVGAVRGAL